MSLQSFPSVGRKQEIPQKVENKINNYWLNPSISTSNKNRFEVLVEVEEFDKEKKN